MVKRPITTAVQQVLIRIKYLSIKINTEAHAARCTRTKAVYHAVGISYQRNSVYRPSMVNTSWHIPIPFLSPHTHLSLKGGHATTKLHTPSGYPDGVALHYTSPIPGVAHWARL